MEKRIWYDHRFRHHHHRHCVERTSPFPRARGIVTPYFWGRSIQSMHDVVGRRMWWRRRPASSLARRDESSKRQLSSNHSLVHSLWSTRSLVTLVQLIYYSTTISQPSKLVVTSKLWPLGSSSSMVLIYKNLRFQSTRHNVELPSQRTLNLLRLFKILTWCDHLFHILPARTWPEYFS